jgi:hypothetical protein
LFVEHSISHKSHALSSSCNIDHFVVQLILRLRQKLSFPSCYESSNPQVSKPLRDIGLSVVDEVRWQMLSLQQGGTRWRPARKEVIRAAIRTIKLDCPRARTAAALASHLHSAVVTSSRWNPDFGQRFLCCWATLSSAWPTPIDRPA